MKDAEKSKKILMWSKVNQFLSEKLKYSQIAKKLGIDPRTVKRLSQIDFETYRQSLDSKIKVKKLSKYEEFIKDKLEFCEDLSSASIEDKLKEQFGSQIDVCPKTVYNYVQEVRQKFGYIKPSKKQRQMSKWDDIDYGVWSQVDFGSMTMKNDYNVSNKVYFMSIVLAKSRAKYFYLQTRPFTTETTIYAHQLAFEYFGGYTEKILYDNDSVLNKDQNCGDILLTEQFASYTLQENFECVFCKIRDPESKGMVENFVKFIKINFLAGRVFKNISILNAEALDWLDRTGNSKVNETTKLRPLDELIKERSFLHPPKLQLYGQVKCFKEYVVLKDNTIKYRGNIYSLPLGTYTDKHAKVKLYSDGEILYINNLHGIEIAVHNIPITKGNYVKNTDHKRAKDKTIETLTQEVIKLLGGSEKAAKYLADLDQDKHRYFKENLLMFTRRLKDFNHERIESSLNFCIDENIFNANTFCEVANSKAKLNKENHNFISSEEKKISTNFSIEPEKSTVTTYKDIL